MRLLPSIVSCVLLVFPGTLFAQASLRVQPLMLEVGAPSQASAISLENTNANDVSLQLRVFEWSQVDGVDRLVPTTDVVVSPPATIVPGGASFTVRVVRTAGAVATGEKSYRLWIDELPNAIPERAQGGAVNIRLRYDLPVFFGERGATPNLSWRAYRSGANLVVEATNAGSGHARVEHLRVGDLSFGDGLNGYVLAGATRRWTSPAGVSVPAANTNVTVVAGVGDGEISAPLTIASN